MPQTLNPAEDQARLASKKMTRRSRDVREEIAKAADLSRFERKLAVLEKRTFAAKA